MVMIKCRVGIGYEEGSSKRRDTVRVFVCVFFVRSFVCGFSARVDFLLCRFFFLRIFCAWVSVRILTRILGGVFLARGPQEERQKILQKPSLHTILSKIQDICQSVLTWTLKNPGGTPGCPCIARLTPCSSFWQQWTLVDAGLAGEC